jgi:hypothetical protein
MGWAGIGTNTGPHGLTEVIFAYASSMANNGQTMASLNANSLFYNATTGVAMLAGRSWQRSLSSGAELLPRAGAGADGRGAAAVATADRVRQERSKRPSQGDSAGVA